MDSSFREAQDLPGVIRAVSGQRGERLRYLLQETGDLRTIARPMRRELRCEELTGLRIDGQMQLTPPPPVLFLSGFAPAVDPEPRAIHQNMNRTTVSAHAGTDGAEVFGAPRKCGVIWDSNVES